MQDRDALPRAVATRHLGPARAESGPRAVALVDAAVGRAIASPGTPLQRLAHRTCSVAAVALPAAALGWATWRAVAAFAEGGSNPAAYLGSSFAINAGLLVALAWALPWLAARKLAPSLVRARELGMARGVDEALEETGERVAAALEAAAAERAALEARRRAAIGAIGDVAPDAGRAPPDALRRLIASDPRPGVDAAASADAGAARAPAAVPSALQGAASEGVRATAHSATDAAPVS